MINSKDSYVREVHIICDVVILMKDYFKSVKSLVMAATLPAAVCERHKLCTPCSSHIV